MAAESEFSSGWKVVVILAIVIGVLAISVSALGKREDPRISDLQERIRQLERKQQGGQPATKGASPIPDRELGE
jgi:hypothetical protein